MPNRVITALERQPDFATTSELSQQYASIYFWRLSQLRGPVQQAARERWPLVTSVPRVLDVPVTKQAWIVGTVYREMKEKPNIIDDIAKINRGRRPQHAQHYGAADDVYYLEDDHGRIELRGPKLLESDVVTGAVVAVLGAKNTEGLFFVDDICEPGVPPKKPSQPRQPGKLAVVSGLLLDEIAHEPKSLALLVDYLSGLLGDEDKVASITRLLIVGDSLTEPPSELVGSRIMRPLTTGESIASLAEYLQALAQVVPVSLLPGATDPASVVLPQDPLHNGLLGPQCAALIRAGALALESNPARLTVGGTDVLVTSGQPAIDMQRYTNSPEIKILEKTLEWRHIAPTAPDTLWTRPFADGDPFILESSPDIYISGNMSVYGTSMVDSVRVVSVPQFAAFGELVLLDLETLETEVVRFG